MLKRGGWFKPNREGIPAGKLLRSDTIDDILADASYSIVDEDRLATDELMAIYVALDDADCRAGESLLRAVCSSFPSPYIKELWRNAGFETLIPQLQRVRVKAYTFTSDALRSEALSLYDSRLSSRAGESYAEWLDRLTRERIAVYPMLRSWGSLSLRWQNDSPSAAPDIHIDGEPLDYAVAIPTIKPIELPPGKHTITVYPSGEFDTWQAEIEVHERKEESVVIDLAKRAPRIKVDLVLLPSVVEVSAKLDGQKWDQTPIAKDVSLVVGEHVLEAQARGYAREKWTFRVEDGLVDRPAFVYRLRYGSTTEDDIAGHLIRVEPTHDDYDRIPLRFGSNLVGRWSKRWANEYDIPIESRYASRWHGEIVVQDQNSTPDANEFEKLQFVLEGDDSQRRDSPFDVLLRVLGRNGLMVMGVHYPGIFGARVRGSRESLSDGDEIGFPGSPRNLYRLELSNLTLGHGREGQVHQRAVVRDGWKLSWRSDDGTIAAGMDISPLLRRWGRLSIGSGVCNPIRIEHESLREVHLILRVPDLLEDQGWLAVAPPRDIDRSARDDSPRGSVEPGERFKLGQVEFILDGPR
jgi:hypothetical protein